MEQIKEAMLDWKSMTILHPICNFEQVMMLQQRNYFHMVTVETPVSQRYSNLLKKYPQLSQRVSFELFCTVDDALAYIQYKYDSLKQNFIEFCIENTRVVVENSGDEKDLLFNLMDKYERVFRPIRPPWDIYFMRIAHLVKQRSNCMKRA